MSRGKQAYLVFLYIKPRIRRGLTLLLSLILSSALGLPAAFAFTESGWPHHLFEHVRSANVRRPLVGRRPPSAGGRKEVVGWLRPHSSDSTPTGLLVGQDLIDRLLGIGAPINPHDLRDGPPVVADMALLKDATFVRAFAKALAHAAQQAGLADADPATWVQLHRLVLRDEAAQFEDEARVHLQAHATRINHFNDDHSLPGLIPFHPAWFTGRLLWGGEAEVLEHLPRLIRHSVSDQDRQLTPADVAALTKAVSAANRAAVPIDPDHLSRLGVAAMAQPEEPLAPADEPGDVGQGTGQGGATPAAGQAEVRSELESALQQHSPTGDGAAVHLSPQGIIHARLFKMSQHVAGEPFGSLRVAFRQARKKHGMSVDESDLVKQFETLSNDVLYDGSPEGIRTSAEKLQQSIQMIRPQLITIAQGNPHIERLYIDDARKLETAATIWIELTRDSNTTVTVQEALQPLRSALVYTDRALYAVRTLTSPIAVSVHIEPEAATLAAWPRAHVLTLALGMMLDLIDRMRQGTLRLHVSKQAGGILLTAESDGIVLAPSEGAQMLLPAVRALVAQHGGEMREEGALRSRIIAVLPLSPTAPAAKAPRPAPSVAPGVAADPPPDHAATSLLLDPLLPLVEMILRAPAARAPYVVGIGGGAGAGKTTFAQTLASALEARGKRTLVIGMDGFFKSVEERQARHTEWDPQHVHLEEARRVLQAIRDGAMRIATFQYSRQSRALEPITLELGGVDVVMFEGSYAIASDPSAGNFAQFVDLPVYLDAFASDLRRWRFQQERAKPYPRTEEAMERHWQEGVWPDFLAHIAPSRANASVVVRADANHQLTIATTPPPAPEVPTGRDAGIGEAEIDRLPLDGTLIEARLNALDKTYSEYLEGAERIGSVGWPGGRLREGAEDMKGSAARAARYARLLEAMKRYAGPLAKKRMLEIGPGSGAFLLALRDLGGVADGLELTSTMIALAQKFAGLTLIPGSVLDPPRSLVQQPYDVTFSRAILGALRDQDEHVMLGKIEWDQQALLQLARLTKLGGISIHEAIEPFGFTEDDIGAAGFEVLEGSIAEQFLVLRRTEVDADAPRPESPSTGRAAEAPADGLEARVQEAVESDRFLKPFRPIVRELFRHYGGFHQMQGLKAVELGPGAAMELLEYLRHLGVDIHGVDYRPARSASHLSYIHEVDDYNDFLQHTPDDSLDFIVGRLALSTPHPRQGWRRPPDGAGAAMRDVIAFRYRPLVAALKPGGILISVIHNEERSWSPTDEELAGLGLETIQEYSERYDTVLVFRKRASSLETSASLSAQAPGPAPPVAPDTTVSRTAEADRDLRALSSSRGKEMAQVLRAILEEVRLDWWNGLLRDRRYRGDYDYEPFPLPHSMIGVEEMRFVLAEDLRAQENPLELDRRGLKPLGVTPRLKQAFEFFIFGETLTRAEVEELFGKHRREWVDDCLALGLCMTTQDQRIRLNGLSMSSRQLETGQVLYLLADTPPDFKTHMGDQRAYVGSDSYMLWERIAKLTDVSGYAVDAGSGAGFQLIAAAKTFPRLEKAIGLEIDQRAINVSLFNASLNGVGDRVVVVESEVALRQALNGHQASLAMINPPLLPMPEFIDIDEGEKAVLSDYIHVVEGEHGPRIDLKALQTKVGWGGIDGLAVAKQLLDIVMPLMEPKGQIIMYAIFAGDGNGPTKIVDYMRTREGFTLEFERYTPRRMFFRGGQMARGPLPMPAPESAKGTLGNLVHAHPALLQEHLFPILAKFPLQVLDAYDRERITMFHYGYAIIRPQGTQPAGAPEPPAEDSAQSAEAPSASRDAQAGPPEDAPRPAPPPAPEVASNHEDGGSEHREARGMAAFHFKGMPAEVLVDPATGELNVSVWEQIIQYVAETVGTRLGVVLEAKVVGSTRYLRSGAGDIDIALVVQNDSPSADWVQAARTAETALREELRHLIETAWPDYRVSSWANDGLGLLGRGVVQSLSHPERSVKFDLFVEPSWEAVHRIIKCDLTVDLVKVLKVLIAREYYLGDSDIWNEMQQVSPDRIRSSYASRVKMLEEQLTDPVRESELLARIAKRLAEPARPFEPETDIKEQVEPALLSTAQAMIEGTGEFIGKASLLNMLRQLIAQGRVFWADHLPGTARAQRMGDGSFRILLDRNLRWLFDGETAYVTNLSPPQRDALTAFLAAKLLHETAELLMESHPDVDWAAGALDPELPNTEAVAYRMELRFLATIPDFATHFAELIQLEPLLWTHLYQPALQPGRNMEVWLRGIFEGGKTLQGYLQALGYDITRSDHILMLEEALRADVRMMLEELEARSRQKDQLQPALRAVVGIRGWHAAAKEQRYGVATVIGEDASSWYLLTDARFLEPLRDAEAFGGGTRFERIGEYGGATLPFRVPATLVATDEVGHLALMKIPQSSGTGDFVVGVAPFALPESLPASFEEVYALYLDYVGQPYHGEGWMLSAPKRWEWGVASPDESGTQALRLNDGVLASWGAPIVNRRGEVIGMRPSDILEHRVVSAVAIRDFLARHHVPGVRIAPAEPAPTKLAGRDAEAPRPAPLFTAGYSDQSRLLSGAPGEGRTVEPFGVEELLTVLERLRTMREAGTSVDDWTLEALMRLGRTEAADKPLNRAIRQELLAWARTTIDLRALACVIAGWAQAGTFLVPEPFWQVPDAVQRDLKPIAHPQFMSFRDTLAQRKEAAAERVGPTPSTKHLSELQQALQQRGFSRERAKSLIRMGRDPAYQRGPLVEGASSQPPPEYATQIRDRMILSGLGERTVADIVARVEAIDVSALHSFLAKQFLQETGHPGTMTMLIAAGGYLSPRRSDPTELDLVAIVDAPLGSDRKVRIPIAPDVPIFRDRSGPASSVEVLDVMFMTREQLLRHERLRVSTANFGIALRGSGLTDVPTGIVQAGQDSLNQLAVVPSLLRTAKEADQWAIEVSGASWQGRAFNRLETANLYLAAADPASAVPFEEVERIHEVLARYQRRLRAVFQGLRAVGVPDEFIEGLEPIAELIVTGMLDRLYALGTPANVVLRDPMLQQQAQAAKEEQAAFIDAVAQYVAQTTPPGSRDAAEAFAAWQQAIERWLAQAYTLWPEFYMVHEELLSLRKRVIAALFQARATLIWQQLKSEVEVVSAISAGKAPRPESPHGLEEMAAALREAWDDPPAQSAALAALAEHPQLTEFWIRSSEVLTSEQRSEVLRAFDDALRRHYVVRLDDIKEPTSDWQRMFGNAQPLDVEIGFGRGAHLVAQAQAHPDVNYLGIELPPTALDSRADAWAVPFSQRQSGAGLDDFFQWMSTRTDRPRNLRVLEADVREVLPKLPQGSLQHIGIYFPSPPEEDGTLIDETQLRAAERREVLFPAMESGVNPLARALFGALAEGGTIDIVTDSILYAQRIVEQLRQAGGVEAHVEMSEHVPAAVPQEYVPRTMIRLPGQPMRFDAEVIDGEIFGPGSARLFAEQRLSLIATAQRYINATKLAPTATPRPALARTGPESLRALLLEAGEVARPFRERLERDVVHYDTATGVVSLRERLESGVFRDRMYLYPEGYLLRRVEFVYGADGQVSRLNVVKGTGTDNPPHVPRSRRWTFGPDLEPKSETEIDHLIVATSEGDARFRERLEVFNSEQEQGWRLIRAEGDTRTRMTITVQRFDARGGLRGTDQYDAGLAVSVEENIKAMRWSRRTPVWMAAPLLGQLLLDVFDAASHGDTLRDGLPPDSLMAVLGRIQRLGQEDREVLHDLRELGWLHRHQDVMEQPDFPGELKKAYFLVKWLVHFLVDDAQRDPAGILELLHVARALSDDPTGRTFLDIDSGAVPTRFLDSEKFLGVLTAVKQEIQRQGERDSGYLRLLLEWLSGWGGASEVHFLFRRYGEAGGQDTSTRYQTMLLATMLALSGRHGLEFSSWVATWARQEAERVIAMAEALSAPQDSNRLQEFGAHISVLLAFSERLRDPAILPLVTRLMSHPLEPYLTRSVASGDQPEQHWDILSEVLGVIHGRLTRQAQEEAVDLLLARLAHPDPWVALAVAEALLSTRAARAEPALVSAYLRIRSQVPLEQANAVDEVLMRLQHPAMVPTALRLLDPHTKRSDRDTALVGMELFTGMRRALRQSDALDETAVLRPIADEMRARSPEEVIQELADAFQYPDDAFKRRHRDDVMSCLRRFAYPDVGAFETLYFLYRLRPAASRVRADLLLARYHDASRIVQEAPVLLGPLWLELFGQNERGRPVISDRQFRALLPAMRQRMGTRARPGLSDMQLSVRHFGTNWPAMVAVASRMLLQGTIKREVEETGRRTIARLDLPIQYQPFMTRNDPAHVREAMQRIWKALEQPDRTSFGSRLRTELGYGVEDFRRDPALYDAFADDVVQLLADFPFKDRETVSEAIASLAYVRRHGVEFQFIARNYEDFHLGCRFSDCTAIGDHGFWSTASYLAHPFYQTLLVYVDGRVVDKLDLTLVRVNGHVELHIDAHEPIPQMQEGDSASPSLIVRQEELFVAAMEEVRRIARAVGVTGIRADGTSNREYLEGAERDQGEEGEAEGEEEEDQAPEPDGEKPTASLPQPGLYEKWFGKRQDVPVELLGGLEPIQRFIQSASPLIGDELIAKKTAILFQATRVGLPEGVPLPGELGSLRGMERRLGRAVETGLRLFRREHDVTALDQAIAAMDFDRALELLRSDPHYRELWLRLSRFITRTQILPWFATAEDLDAAILMGFHHAFAPSSIIGFARLYVVPLEGPLQQAVTPPTASNADAPILPEAIFMDGEVADAVFMMDDALDQPAEASATPGAIVTASDETPRPAPPPAAQTSPIDSPGTGLASVGIGVVLTGMFWKVAAGLLGGAVDGAPGLAEAAREAGQQIVLAGWSVPPLVAGVMLVGAAGALVAGVVRLRHLAERRFRQAGLPDHAGQQPAAVFGIFDVNRHFVTGLFPVLVRAALRGRRKTVVAQDPKDLALAKNEAPHAPGEALQSEARQRSATVGEVGETSAPARRDTRRHSSPSAPATKPVGETGRPHSQPSAIPDNRGYLPPETPWLLPASGPGHTTPAPDRMPGSNRLLVGRSSVRRSEKFASAASVPASVALPPQAVKATPPPRSVETVGTTGEPAATFTLEVPATVPPAGLPEGPRPHFAVITTNAETALPGAAYTAVAGGLGAGGRALERALHLTTTTASAGDDEVEVRAIPPIDVFMPTSTLSAEAQVIIHEFALTRSNA